MKKTLIVSLCVVFAMTSLAAVSFAKNVPGKRLADANFESTPMQADLSDLPAAQRALARPNLAAAAADTFHLAWYSFDNGPSPDPMGWVRVDLTSQIDTFFHVADASELNGGTFGNLNVLGSFGTQSIWCGVFGPTTIPPYCGYSNLPGYGNSWNQILGTDDIAADSIRIYYEIFWDSEPGYDATTLQYLDNTTNTWVELPVNAGVGNYDGLGQLIECFEFTVPGHDTLGGTATTRLRFQFIADGAWSDEDGLWPTDGACLIDSITVEAYNWYKDIGGNMQDSLLVALFSDFEVPTAGAASTTNYGDAIWQGKIPPPFGEFGDIYPALGGLGALGVQALGGTKVLHTGLQEDPCFLNLTNLWAWFDDPNITNYNCHTPAPQPLQGSLRFGPDAAGLYLDNEIWSPLISIAGSSGAEWRLTFLTYRDLPLDNLLFYKWAIRSWDAANCPGQWRNFNFVYFGGQRDWLRTVFSIGQLIDPGVVSVQLAVGAVDACPFWCNQFGSGACHAQAPLIDEVHLVRVKTFGPQYTVRHLDLFQDNFSADGTITGVGRSDSSNDVRAVDDPLITPGDSIVIVVDDPAEGMGTDPTVGGSAVYCYVAVWPQGQPGKAGENIESPDIRVPPQGLALGKRWPLVDSLVHDGVTWYCLRMDTAYTGNGGIVNQAKTRCFDLNDSVFEPQDTICYVFCATNDAAVPVTTYFSRRINGAGVNFTTTDLWEALSSPMEFQILPGGGWKAGGDILYVDDADDRAGPPQLLFDTAFDVLGLLGKVDRYDVNGPSSNVGNSLGSRLVNAANQLDCYQKIFWCTANLSSGLVCDGGAPNGGSSADKSDDWTPLFNFVDQGLNNKGIYFSGDDLAFDWITLIGASAVQFRTTYMDFALGGSAPGDHVQSGEPVSPNLVAVGPCFIHLGQPDTLIAYGGCAAVNDFDLLIPLQGQVEFSNPGSGAAYVISQTTENAVGDTSRVILSGFSYNYIRSTRPGFPDARTEHLRDIITWLRNETPNATGVNPKVATRNELLANYPNPFNPVTTIFYNVKDVQHVSLKVYNVAGQLVKTLVDEFKSPVEGGQFELWSGNNNAGQSVASGVYFYKLVTANFTQTRKMVLLK